MQVNRDSSEGFHRIIANSKERKHKIDLFDSNGI